MATASETIAIYNAVLQRDPTDAELAAFVASSQTPEDEASQIDVLVNSTEARSDVYPFIQLYQAIFGRVPDAAGLTFWVTQLRAGVTIQTIVTGDASLGIDGFANSAEFIAAFGAGVDPTSETFVTALYQNFLGRDPDAAGLAFFTGLGDDATVGDVVIAFTSSPEFSGAIGAQIDVFLTKAANGTQDYLGSVYDTDDDGDVDGDDVGAAGVSVNLAGGTLTISGNADANVVVNLSTDPGTVDGENLDGDVDTVDASGLTTFGIDFTGSAAAETVTGSEQADIIRGGSGDMLDGNGGNDVFGLSTGVNVTGGEGDDEFHVTSNSTNNVIADFDSDGDEITFLDNGDNAGGSVNFANSADNVEGAAGATLNAGDLDATAASIQSVDNLDNRVYVVQGAQTEAQIATANVPGGAANSYVVVFNTTSGKGEIWFDNDWTDVANRSKVATLDNVTSLAGVTALTAADFGVYATDGSDAGPADPGDVTNFALTPNFDQPGATEGNDNYIGAQADSLNDVDIIDGMGGDDMINVTQTGATATADPTIAGVEKIFIEDGEATAATTIGLDQANITGLKELWIKQADNNQVVTAANSQLTTTFGITGSPNVANVNYNVNFAMAPMMDLSGTDDTIMAAIDSTNTGNNGNNLVLSSNRAADIEGISLTLIDDATDTNGSDIDAFTGLTSFAATGAGNLILTGASFNSTELAEVDVSGIGGAVTGVDLSVSTSEVTYMGAKGSDVMTGGGNDDDMIFGNGGDDVLFGGGANDVLDGGAGQDDMSGDGGADTFIISDEGVLAAADIDLVADFSGISGGELDKVDFASFDVAGDGTAPGVNYEEGAAAVANFAAALTAANTQLDGTTLYYGVESTLEGGFLVFADTDNNGEADQAVLLTGITAATFAGEDIIA